MPAASSIPADSPLSVALDTAVRRHRILVIAGLPGIGKSLLTQQAARLARTAGRDVCLLQWDVARAAFATDEAVRARYPEVAGITHAIIRLAVDKWSRIGIARWQAAGDGLLIVEAPLIGGRLLALTQPMDDAAEMLLASAATLFLLPVPTAAVKAALRSKRLGTQGGDPAQREALDANVAVLDAHVAEIDAAGAGLGVAGSGAGGYDPEVYAAVYLHAMRHRRCQRFEIDRLFDIRGSVHTQAHQVTELTPTPAEIAAAFAAAEAVAAPVRDRQQAEWYR